MHKNIETRQQVLILNSILPYKEKIINLTTPYTPSEEVEECVAGTVNRKKLQIEEVTKELKAPALFRINCEKRGLK